MKTTDIVKLVLEGHLVCVGEFRGSTQDEIKWSERKTGKAVSASVYKHNLERPDGSPIQLTQWPEKGQIAINPAAIPKLKKGDKCLAVLTAWSESNGVVKATGTLNLLEA